MDYDALENVLRHSVITFGGVVQTDLGNKSADAIAALRSEPIDMVLYCPKCGLQHIDEPSESWDNPPHKSHLCHRCGLIWRPCDRPTNGVCATATVAAVPSKVRPVPYFPCAVHATLVSVAALLVPEVSAAVVPAPSLNP